MQGIINNRFVGTLILIIAAIILLPSILDGEKQGAPQRFKTIPKQPELQAIEQAPEFDSKVIDERFADVDKADETVHAIDDTEMASAPSEIEQEDSQTAEAMVLATETIQVAKVAPVNGFGLSAETTEANVANDDSESESSVEQTSNQDTATTHFESQGWVIQLGAFRNTANVQSLKSKLNKAGYVVITEKIKVKTGVLTKVYVGPELDKAVLEKALPELTKLTKLAGKITKYQP